VRTYSCDVWQGSAGEMGAPKLPKFSLLEMLVIHNAITRRVLSGPKTASIIPCKDVRFGDVNDVPLNFYNQNPQNEILVP